MRRAAGQLEEAVLRLLGDTAALTVSEVREAIDPALAHTTVMTTLVRLTNKGLVVRQRRGRSFAYSLPVAAAELPALRSALRMRTELDSRAERADVLANFVAALEPGDEELLRALLAESDESGTGR